MKVGDWVVHEDGRIGQITLLHSMDRGYHLVDYQDNTFARATHHSHLTVFDPAVSDILTAVNTNER
jgi:hypothetical protein